MASIIGNRIQQLRKRRGFSQEALADKLCISRASYQRIEAGESNNWINLIEKLCAELQVNPDDLFTQSDGLVQNNSGNSSAVQNHTQHDTHITINHLSDKIIELYEAKIKMLEKEIKRLDGCAG